MSRTGILQRVRQSAASQILYLPHAVRQMSRPERVISADDVRRVVETGKIIEDYPEDPRGHSALLLGIGGGGRPIHVVCSPKDGYLAVVTAYLPNPSEWSDDFSKRTT